MSKLHTQIATGMMHCPQCGAEPSAQGPKIITPFDDTNRCSQIIVRCHCRAMGPIYYLPKPLGREELSQLDPAPIIQQWNAWAINPERPPLLHSLIAHAAGYPEPSDTRPSDSLKRHECPYCKDDTYSYMVEFPGQGRLLVWACWQAVCGLRCSYFHIP